MNCNNRTSKLSGTFFRLLVLLRPIPPLLISLLLAGCGIFSSNPDQYQPKVAVYHVVKKGETLTSIARNRLVNEDTLLLLNKVDDPQQPKVGQRLLIGYKDASSVSANGSIKRVGYAPPAYKDGLVGWPVQGGWIVSQFGPRQDSFHDGLDIAATTGTPVIAAHNGQVIYSGNDLGGYGNLLLIKGDDKLMSVYAHNSELLVKQGESVKRGQVIAEVGATGHAEGPHLHFEVRMQDKFARYVAMYPIPLLERKKELRPRFRVNESLTPIFARLWK